ncbi:MarR family winged helix-turn-helix transcriptional regulator [Halanaerobaculum tunisiense]
MIDKYLHNCLYFTANKLSRAITKMAEEEFRIVGLTPNYAFLLIIVYENEGVGQKEIGEKLHLAPSTVTRFVDKLKSKGLVEKKSEGKRALIYLTDKGIELQDDIRRAWKNLHKRYSEILGEDAAEELNQLVDEAGIKLEENL